MDVFNIEEKIALESLTPFFDQLKTAPDKVTPELLKKITQDIIEDIRTKEFGENKNKVSEYEIKLFVMGICTGEILQIIISNNEQMERMHNLLKAIRDGYDEKGK